LQIYNELLKKPNCDSNIYTYKACCLYALCKFKEGLEEAKKGVPTELNVNIYIYIYNYMYRIEYDFI
jgi:intraflagellar transport protein 56